MRCLRLLLLPALVVACTDKDDSRSDTGTEPSTTTHTDGAPSASIRAPTEDGVYYVEAPITFAGTVTDGEDDPDDLEVWWTSSLDEPLDVEPVPVGGEIADLGYLTAGVHQISLWARDSSGNEGRDSVAITVGGPNSAPTCSITAPEDEEAFAKGDEITFEAMITDENLTTVQATWSSDRDPAWWISSTPNLSTGAVSVSTSELDTGTHVVTLMVTDERGEIGNCQLTITIGTPPAVTILTPDPDAAERLLYHEGATVVFAAQVEDEGTDSVDLVWASDLDGVLTESAALPGEEIEFSDADLTVGDHTVTLTGTNLDGLTDTDQVSFTINGCPTAPTISLGPDPAITSVDLTVDVDVAGIDPEDGPVKDHLFVWSRDGVLESAHTDATVPAASTTKGETWSVEVTPADSDGCEGEPITAALTVSNAEPTISAVTISSLSGAVASGAELVCSVTASDVDGDLLTESFVWMHKTRKTILGTLARLTVDTDETDPTDEVVCTATVDDGDGGSATHEATVEIENTDPTVDTVTLSPNREVMTGTELECSATASDVDDETPTLDYAWTVDGVTQRTTAETLELTSVNSDVGDDVVCTVTAEDGYGGVGADSASVTIENTAPTVDVVVITPNSGVTSGATLTCAATASDADGDTPILSYSWENTTTGDPLITGADTVTLTPSDVQPGDTVRCVVTASDSDGGSSSDSTTVEVENTDPEFTSSATISPSTDVTSSETLSCSASATDTDGDTPAISYAWVNTTTGDDLGEDSSLELSPATVTPGDVVQCTAAATDAHDGSVTSTDSVTVANSDPLIASVSIDPSSGVVTTAELTCSADATDPDGGSVSAAYAWSDDTTGAALGASTVYTVDADETDPGDTLSCTVTVTDAHGGTATDIATVQVDNTAPSVSMVSVTDPVFAGDTISCSWSFSDIDGDTDQSTVSWSIGGTEVTSGDTLSTGFVGDDEVTCTVTPYDGTDAGDPVAVSVTVSNTAPAINAVSISPDPATSEDTLTCSYSGFSDADGDADASTYAWTADGTSVGADNTLADAFSRDETVTCTVTPYDGEDTGAPVSASLTISNSPPEVTAVSLNPNTVYTDDTISASMSTSDADGDAVSLSYEWMVDGATVAETGSTLDGAAYFEKGQTVALVVTPTDGDEDGDTAASETLTVANSLPTAPELSISPEAPLAGSDDLLCQIATVSTDDDDDPVTYSFAWTVDGTTFEAGSTSSNGLAWSGPETTSWDGDTVPADDVVSGEEWTCTAIPDDGETEGSSASVTVEFCPEATYYADADSDGFGDSDSYTVSCDGDIPSGYIDEDTDCDDDDASISPAASESCNGEDDDCDGSTDEGVTTTYYEDDDSDGYGDASSTTEDCSRPSGYVTNDDDCKDSAANTYPGAASSDSATACMTDADGDGWGSDSPSSGVTAGSDCADGNSSRNPDADEYCSTSYDDDCDGTSNENSAVDASTWYTDADGDGYTTSGSTKACTEPSSYSAYNHTDCLDSDANTYPGAAPNDSSSACMTDADGDDYGDDSASSGVTDGTDCDDSEASAYVGSGNEDDEDGIDNDCDGIFDENVTFNWDQSVTMSGGSPIYIIDLSPGSQSARHVFISGYDNQKIYGFNYNTSAVSGCSGLTSTHDSYNSSGTPKNCFTSSGTNGSMGHNPRSISKGFVNSDSYRDVVSVNAAIDGGTPKVRSLLLQSAGNPGTPSSNVQTDISSYVSEPRAVALLDDCSSGSSPTAHFMAIGDNAGSNITFWDNTGSGTWAYVKSVSTGGSTAGPVRFREVDVSGDGTKDIISANGEDDSVTVVKISYSGSCSSSSSLSTSKKTYSGFDRVSGIAVDDFTGDGAADIALVSYNDHYLYILENNGSGTFSSGESYDIDSDFGLSSCSPDGVSSGDFNDDGNTDLVVVCKGQNKITFYMGYGDGSFDPTTKKSTGNSPREAVVYDFDQDGYDDIVVVNYGAETAQLFHRF